MAKRFTDSDKWKKPWFRRLQPAHKLLWSYILDNCDHAGIWDVDFDLASYHIGEDVNQLDAMEDLRKQYLPFACGKKWFVVDFVDFQYGELKATNNAHGSVISILKRYGLWEPYLAKRKAEADLKSQENSGAPEPLGYPSRGAQDKDKDQDKDQDQDLEIQKEEDSNASAVPEESIRATRKTLLKEQFDKARKRFPGSKGGLTVEWENFEKKNRKTLEETIPKLLPAIEAEEAHKAAIAAAGRDPPAWKHFATWINKRCWEQELEEVNGKTGSGWRRGSETRSQLMDGQATRFRRELEAEGSPPAHLPDVPEFRDAG